MAGYRRRSGGRIAGVPARAFPRTAGIRRIGALGRVRRGRDGRRLHPRALRRGGRDRGLVRGAPLRRTVRLHRARAGDFPEGQPMATGEDAGRCVAADHQPVSPALPDRRLGPAVEGAFEVVRCGVDPSRFAPREVAPARHQQRRPARREEGLRLLLARSPVCRSRARLVGSSAMAPCAPIWSRRSAAGDWRIRCSCSVRCLTAASARWSSDRGVRAALPGCRRWRPGRSAGRADGGARAREAVVTHQ